MKRVLLFVMMLLSAASPARAGHLGPGAHCPGYEASSRNPIVGTDGGDNIVGTDADDIICGLGGSDTIDGRGGNDLLLGGEGDDVLFGRTGDDVLSGGPFGSDTASYLDGAGPVSVNLSYNGTYGAAGGQGTDVLYDIENVRGTAYDDRLTGNGRANDLRGEHGDDVLQGLGGPDLLVAGFGNSTLRGGDGPDVLVSHAGELRIEGGEGRDTVSYGQFGPGMTLNLNLGYFGTYGPGVAHKCSSCGRDVLVSVENVNGTNDPDRLVGDARANILHAGKGDDDLRGQSGNDLLFAGPGADELRGGPGDDLLSASSGIDYCDQGAGAGRSIECEIVQR